MEMTWQWARFVASWPGDASFLLEFMSMAWQVLLATP
jgi:hypothetical protein